MGQPSVPGCAQWFVHINLRSPGPTNQVKNQTYNADHGIALFSYKPLGNSVKPSALPVFHSELRDTPEPHACRRTSLFAFIANCFLNSALSKTNPKCSCLAGSTNIGPDSRPRREGREQNEHKEVIFTQMCSLTVYPQNKGKGGEIEFLKI